MLQRATPIRFYRPWDDQQLDNPGYSGCSRATNVTRNFLWDYFNGR